MMERTFVMVKPDGVGRRLSGAVIQRYEAKGLRLVGVKMQIISRELADEHYAEHREKPFFEELVAFITSGPVIQMVWEGPGAVGVVRQINGATRCLEADVGTVRGDFGLSTTHNVVHAADSVETAQREIALYFSEDELWDYEMPDAAWLGE